MATSSHGGDPRTKPMPGGRPSWHAKTSPSRLCFRHTRAAHAAVDCGAVYAGIGRATVSRAPRHGRLRRPALLLPRRRVAPRPKLPGPVAAGPMPGPTALAVGPRRTTPPGTRREPSGWARAKLALPPGARLWATPTPSRTRAACVSASHQPVVRSQAAGRGSGESSMKCPWVSLGALLVAQIAYGADRFDSALARARENESSPAGETYARSISGPFGNEVWKAMKRCVATTRRVHWT